MTAVTCSLCKHPLTTAYVTADGHGPFCEPCYDFFWSRRAILGLQREDDKRTGQGAFAWAYALSCLKRPPWDQEQEHNDAGLDD